MTGMAGVALRIAVTIGGGFFAAIMLDFAHVSTGDADQTFVADLVAARAAAVSLFGDGARLAVPCDLGLHHHPAEVVLACLVLFHLLFVALTAGFCRGHRGLGPVIHRIVVGAVAIMATNFLLFLFGVRVWTVKMLGNDSRCYIDVASQAVLMGHLVFVQTLLGFTLSRGNGSYMPHDQRKAKNS